MRVYRIEDDINRFCGFRFVPLDVAEEVEQMMHRSKPVSALWKPYRVQVIAGRKGDFASSPMTYTAPLALNSRAVSALRPYIEGPGELLPFRYRKDEYWILYLPTPVDCLDAGGTQYRTERREPNNIRKAAFIPNRLSDQHIFRIPGGFDYFITSELKRVIEQNNLTGLKFELMWSDEGEEADNGTSVAPEERVERKRVSKPGRLSKRERLLRRLWEEVINSWATDERLDEQMASGRDAARESPSILVDAGRILNAAIKQGVPKADLADLARSLAYQVVFDVLVAIEEEGADTSPALRSLHEDLLIANPDR